LRLCSAENVTDQYFTVSECSPDEVMNIESAVLGYSELYNASSNSPKRSWCPWSNCTEETHVPTQLCNGSRVCQISQTILLVNKDNKYATCRLKEDGNFIEINFTCVKGMTSESFLYFITVISVQTSTVVFYRTRVYY